MDGKSRLIALASMSGSEDNYIRPKANIQSFGVNALGVGMLQENVSRAKQVFGIFLKGLQLPKLC
jgi:hypothetical protein